MITVLCTICWTNVLLNKAFIKYGKVNIRGFKYYIHLIFYYQAVECFQNWRRQSSRRGIKVTIEEQDAYFLLEKCRKFQQFYGLNATGKMEQETAALMNLSRCGVPDILDNAK